MKPQWLIATALSAALALPADAARVLGPKEQCFGIAKAGQNDCAAMDEKHGCHTLAQIDHDPNDWIYVAAGTCQQLGGSLDSGSARKPATQGKPA
ncbi:DUF2282 domain-containing protein [Neisseriaceae bacterium JH1-16]|nr:DUF2282 domain-containing protein [Neisseriaceae bacterium JH1-16]